MSTTSPPPDWYPDPTGRFQQRYWDGSQWTDHVASNGQAATDPVGGGAPGGFAGGASRSAADDQVPVGKDRAERVQRQVANATGFGPGASPGGAAGGGSLLDQPVLVVNQKAKLIEITNQYAVYDQNGTQIGGVQEVGQSAAKKALRLLSNVDQFLTHKLEIKDMAGNVLLHVTRPAKIMKSTVIVAGPQGHEIGKIVQQNMIGKIRFGLEAGGQPLGMINAENWRAWNFSVTDASGTEVARITKTWEGLGKALFTTADNYVVQIHRPLADPLRSLVVAAALTVDTALKQDEQ